MNPQMFMDCELDKLRELKDNYKWLYSNYEVFKTTYKNQFIAIKDEEHLDNDTILGIITKIKTEQRFQWVNCNRVHPWLIPLLFLERMELVSQYTILYHF